MGGGIDGGVGGVEKGRVGEGKGKRYWGDFGRGGGMSLICLLQRMNCRIDCRIWDRGVASTSRVGLVEVLGVQQDVTSRPHSCDRIQHAIFSNELLTGISQGVLSPSHTPPSPFPSPVINCFIVTPINSPTPPTPLPANHLNTPILYSAHPTLASPSSLSRPKLLWLTGPACRIVTPPSACASSMSRNAAMLRAARLGLCEREKRVGRV